MIRHEQLRRMSQSNSLIDCQMPVEFKQAILHFLMALAEGEQLAEDQRQLLCKTAFAPPLYFALIAPNGLIRARDLARYLRTPCVEDCELIIRYYNSEPHSPEALEHGQRLSIDDFM